MKQLTILFTIAIVALATATATAQVRFGAKAGFTLATAIPNYEQEEFEPDYKMQPTFNVGVLGEFDLSENFGIGAGLVFQGKGAKIEESGFEGSINAYYLQVPVNVYYQNSGFFAAVGPYIGFGIGGKTKLEFLGEEEEEDIKFGNDEEDDVAPLDFGVGAEVGYSINPIRITLNYNFGLANVIPDANRADGDLKDSFTTLSLNVAYLFGGQE